MRWLSRHLWIHLVGYVVVVAGFATVYALIPDQFYYSTLQFEPETEQLRDRMRESLAADIKRNMEPGFTGIPSVGPWRFMTSGFSLACICWPRH
jgi:hypothetical protein